MNTTTKNILLGFAGSAILISAVALTATPNKMMRDFDRPGNNQKIHKQMQNNMEANWSNFAASYNLSQNDIKTLLDKGYSPRDIHHSAFLATASGKTLNEVIALKTPNNTWQDVEKTLNLTVDQLKATRNNLISTKLTTALNIDKTTIDNLLAAGYHPKDISMASALATKANKSINDVLGMKAINNTWLDISQQLGIDKATFDNILADHRTKLAPIDGMGYGMMDGSGMGMMKNGPHHSFGKGNDNPPRNPEDCLRNN